MPTAYNIQSIVIINTIRTHEIAKKCLQKLHQMSNTYEFSGVFCVFFLTGKLPKFLSKKYCLGCYFVWSLMTNNFKQKGQKIFYVSEGIFFDVENFLQ